MKSIELFSDIESVIGQYKQLPFSKNYKSFVNAVNRAVASVIPEAQPKELLKTCYFIKKDAVSDYLIWKPFASEEASSLQNELAKLTPTEIDALPSHELSDLEYKLASIQTRSTRRRLQESNSSLYNNQFIFTYDEDEFISHCNTENTVIESGKFIQNIVIDIKKSHSRYIRAIIYDENAPQPKYHVCDVLFRSFIVSQNVKRSGFSLILNNEDKTITISSYKSGLYRVEVYSACYQNSATAFYIKGNRMYANGEIDSALNKYSSIKILAYIIPPVILTENQIVAKELHENKLLYDLIVYASANAMSKLLGFPQEDINRSYFEALNAYSEASFSDKLGDYNQQTIAMY